MPSTLWLARARSEDGAVSCLRCRTEGEAPGPLTAWEAIADPVRDARLREAPCDLHTLVAEAPALAAAAALTTARLLAPLEPQTVFGVGRNYRAHAQELGNEVPSSPLVFLKPPSCLIPSGDALALPRGYERIDMEAELVVVIGRRARGVAAAQAWEHVGGYLLGNDVSCRDLQRSDKQWTRAKGLDGFGPVSAFVRLAEPGEVLPVHTLELRAYLDDLEVQRGRLSAMVFSIPALIEHLSEHMTLEPGDLIFTGTPAGVSPLAPGQVVRVEIDGIALGGLVTPVT